MAAKSYLPSLSALRRKHQVRRTRTVGRYVLVRERNHKSFQKSSNGRREHRLVPSLPQRTALRPREKVRPFYLYARPTGRRTRHKQPYERREEPTVNTRTYHTRGRNISSLSRSLLLTSGGGLLPLLAAEASSLESSGLRRQRLLAFFSGPWQCKSLPMEVAAIFLPLCVGGATRAGREGPGTKAVDDSTRCVQPTANAGKYITIYLLDRSNTIDTNAPQAFARRQFRSDVLQNRMLTTRLGQHAHTVDTRQTAAQQHTFRRSCKKCYPVCRTPTPIVERSEKPFRPRPKKRKNPETRGKRTIKDQSPPPICRARFRCHRFRAVSAQSICMICILIALLRPPNPMSNVGSDKPQQMRHAYIVLHIVWLWFPRALRKRNP